MQVKLAGKWEVGGELTQLVERILSSSNNPVTSVEKLLSERYGGRGPFTAELGIALSFCLREPTVTRVCEKLRQWVKNGGCEGEEPSGVGIAGDGSCHHGCRGGLS